MKPTKDNVLVERIPGPTLTHTGIILKSTLEPDRGKVKSIGPDVTEVSVGDEVFLDWNMAVKVENEDYIVSVENVVFIFDKD